MTAARPPRILSIAGSDSSGGAGIQADIKTIMMLDGYAMTAITAVTAQNSMGVQAVTPISAEIVAQQIESCGEDIGIDAIKIGMLHNSDIITAVAESLANCRIAPIVVDPVMIATSGASLLAPNALEAMRTKLFPMATIITPNLPELSHLTNRAIDNFDQMTDAAHALRAETGASVLAKGGHAEGPRILDLLALSGTNGRDITFEHDRIDTPHTHGTGCTLSSAIATLIGRGENLETAVRLGRHFVLKAIQAAPGFGAGSGPLGHQAVRSLKP